MQKLGFLGQSSKPSEQTYACEIGCENCGIFEIGVHFDTQKRKLGQPWLLKSISWMTMPLYVLCINVQNRLDPSRTTEIFSVPKRRNSALPKFVRHRKKSGLQ